MTTTPALSSWRDGPARQAILDFVANAVATVPVQERVAVFDNDGTLWCEQPVPIQGDFILRRLAAMAEADTSLRTRQPWKAAYERDHAWLDGLMAEHYAGDDTNVRILAGGILKAYEGMSVEEFDAAAHEFLHTAWLAERFGQDQARLFADLDDWCPTRPKKLKLPPWWPPVPDPEPHPDWFVDFHLGFAARLAVVSLESNRMGESIDKAIERSMAAIESAAKPA